MRNINLDVDPTQDFEPGMFSVPELHFLREHLEHAPVVAFDDFDPTAHKEHRGVIRARVQPFLERVYELRELEKAKHLPWCGVKALYASIERFLHWHDRCLEIKRRSRGVFVNPSMFVWDDMGKAFRYAIGSDSGEMVRTEIADDGSRQSFRVRLMLDPIEALGDLSEIMPWSRTKAEVVSDKLETGENGKLGYVRCPICQHTEEYTAGSQTKKMAALGRMAKHLKRATDEVNRHRLLYTKSFR